MNLMKMEEDNLLHQRKLTNSDILTKRTMTKDGKCSIHNTELEYVGIHPFRIPRCPVCTDEYNARIEYDLAFNESNLPLRYKNKLIDDFLVNNEKQVDIKNKLIECLNNRFSSGLGKNLMMIGSTRSGKTMAATIIGTSNLRNGKKVLYRAAWAIVRAIREARDYSTKDYLHESESEIVKKCSNVDLLIIDEVGTMFTQSKIEVAFIHEITHNRFNNMKDTILISNLTIEELKNFVGDPVIAIFKEVGDKLLF